MLVMLQDFQNKLQIKNHPLVSLIWFSINKIAPIELMINSTQISFKFKTQANFQKFQKNKFVHMGI